MDSALHALTRSQVNFHCDRYAVRWLFKVDSAGRATITAFHDIEIDIR